MIIARIRYNGGKITVRYRFRHVPTLPNRWLVSWRAEREVLGRPEWASGSRDARTWRGMRHNIDVARERIDNFWRVYVGQ